jgi:diguanylate cyclase (GGDEF)-like protein
LIRADEDIGRERANAIRKDIAGHKFHVDGKDLRVTVSIGLFIFNVAEYAHRTSQILSNVDAAMYKAKEHGRNMVEEFIE